MKTARNPSKKYWSKGIAIITVMMIIIAATAILVGVIYYLGKGIQISGIQRTYQTAKEASHGGIEVFTKEILPAVIAGDTLSNKISTFLVTNLATANASNECFSHKITLDTVNWSNCSSSNKTGDPKESPDVTFLLRASGTVPSYKVYVKIINTVKGNTDTSGLSGELGGGAVTVGAGSGVIYPEHHPYLYNMEIQGERTVNPNERTNIGILYAY